MRHPRYGVKNITIHAIRVVRDREFFRSSRTLPLEGMNPLLSFLTFSDVKTPDLRDQRMLRIRKAFTGMPRMGSDSKTP